MSQTPFVTLREVHKSNKRSFSGRVAPAGARGAAYKRGWHGAVTTPLALRLHSRHTVTAQPCTDPITTRCAACTGQDEAGTVRVAGARWIWARRRVRVAMLSLRTHRKAMMDTPSPDPMMMPARGGQPQLHPSPLLDRQRSRCNGHGRLPCRSQEPRHGPTPGSGRHSASGAQHLYSLPAANQHA